MKDSPDTLSHHDRLMDAAKRNAARLREHAIDEFWSDAGCAARRALRSAQRLAARLAHHSRMRRDLEA